MKKWFHLFKNSIKSFQNYQVIIAQWLAWWLATGEVPGSNRDKGDNLINFWLKRKFNNLNSNTILVWVYELNGLVKRIWTGLNRWYLLQIVYFTYGKVSLCLWASYKKNNVCHRSQPAFKCLQEFWSCTWMLVDTLKM